MALGRTWGSDCGPRRLNMRLNIEVTGFRSSGTSWLGVRSPASAGTWSP